MVDSEKTKNAALTYYEDPNNLKKLCDFLRSRQGPKLREAVLMENRVYYQKGEKLVDFLYEPKKGTKWPSKLPRFESRQDVNTVCKSLCRDQYIIRADKVAKGELSLSNNRMFDESGYFVWVYEGDKTMSYLMSSAVVVAAVAFSLQPIWPLYIRVFLWYLSISFLIFIASVMIIRLFLFTFMWVIGFDFWILPNLWDETLGFYESFVPLYSIQWSKSDASSLLIRLAVGGGFVYFCYWAVTQPSEFDNFVAGQGDFVKDLYAGTLLSDMSQSDRDNIDKPMQSLEDLLRTLDEEIEKENDLLGLDEDLDEDQKIDEMLDNLVDTEDVKVSDEE